MAERRDRISTRSRTTDDIRREVIQSIPVLAPGWTSHGSDEPGMAITDVLVGVSDGLHYNLDKQAREAFLSLAVLPESIYANAQMLHYRPRRWVAAQGEVILNVPSLPSGSSPVTDDIVIPGLTHIVAKDNHTLILLEETIIPEGFTGQLSIPAIEGESKSYIITTSPENLFDIPLPRENIAEQLFEIYIDGELWYDATDHPLSTEIDNFYYIKKNPDGVYHIGFRNSRGRVPQYNQDVEVKYIVTSGENFNANLIDDSETPAEIEGAVWSYTDFVNASLEETPQQTVDRAPAKNSTADRAVTLADYRELAKGLPNVKSVYVAKNSLGWNTVEIYVATLNGDPASVELLQMVKEFFEQRNNLVVSVRTYSAIFKRFNLGISIKVSSGFNATKVLTDVKAKLGSELSYGSLGFSTAIRISDIYAIVEAIPGVEYSNINSLFWITSQAGVSNLVPRDSEHPLLNILTVTLE